MKVNKTVLTKYIVIKDTDFKIYVLIFGILQLLQLGIWQILHLSVQ